jgi:hypothetical protein
LVQAAITAALEVYCNGESGPQLWQFPPYANQQGDGMRKYCADIVGMLDNAQVILLEIKERDCEINLLRQFDSAQHASNLRFQSLGVPIAYAYNTAPVLEYHKRPRAPAWPQITLGQIKRSTPLDLPNASPAVANHPTLLRWLQDARGEDAAERLGQIHGAISSPSDLRNGVLVLLYGVAQHRLASLMPDQLVDVLACLQNNSSLKQRHHQKLQRILGASADVFNQFMFPPESSPSEESVPPKP